MSPAAMGKAGKKPNADDADYHLTGETLGIWRLLRGIGRGGMGEVYEAEYDFLHLLTLRYPPEERGLIRVELAALPRDEQSRLASEMLGTPLPADARFAIKVCGARSGTAGHRRFLQEAELAQRLGTHPHIVTVHAINGGAGDLRAELRFPLERGRWQDVAYMVMDLAGRTFDAADLELTESVHVVRCIALALDHAHKQGVVHRDLKPENILGTIEHPLLTDFGIAKEIDQSLGLTRTGQIIGTLDYMSPEQATDAKSVDQRSDIYSLGIVLYEFTTKGHLPYIHLSEREAALAAIRSEREEPRWPRDHVPEFPRGLEYIILKAIAHDPDQRYQDMVELVSDLDRWRRDEWILPIGRVWPLRFARHFVRRHPRAVWGIGGVLSAAVLLWLVFLIRDWSDATRRRFAAGVAELANVVVQVEGRQRPQLTSAERQRLIEDLGRDLRLNRDDYPELGGSWESWLERLNRARYLKCDFTSGAGLDASDWLAAAADFAHPSWRLREGGLLLPEGNILLLRGPYGSGTIGLHLRAILPNAGDGFRLEVNEARDPRHLTQVAIERSRLEVLFVRDEVVPQPIGGAELTESGELDLYLDCSPAGVRVWVMPWMIADHQQHAGLREGSGAAIRLTLPAGTILQRLEVWPQAWPSR